MSEGPAFRRMIAGAARDASPAAADFKTGPGHRRHANRWGGRALLSTNPLFSNRTTAVLLDTPLFDRSYLWRIDFLFASINDNLAHLTTSPGLFTPMVVCPTEIVVRHGVDERGGTVDDVYNLTIPVLAGPGAGGLINPVWMPVSNWRSRILNVAVTISRGEDSHGNVFDTEWVDVSATPIESVDTEQIISSRGGSNIFGFGSTFPQRVPQSATAVELLPADATRRKFWIVNKATAGNLFLAFGGALSLSPGSERFTIELAPGATYESAEDEYWGNIEGIWDAAGTGYAMVSTSNIFA